MNLNKQNATVISVILLILNVLLSITIQLLPDSVKLVLSKISSTFGLSYTIFWLLLFILILVLILFFVWKQALRNKEEVVLNKGMQNIDTKNNSSRTINQYGSNSTYVENIKGDINIKN